jgi:hypothetical protein
MWAMLRFLINWISEAIRLVLRARDNQPKHFGAILFAPFTFSGYHWKWRPDAINKAFVFTSKNLGETRITTGGNAGNCRSLGRTGETRKINVGL